MTFADEDLSGADPDWFCVRGDLAVDTARALKYIETELYKLTLRSLIPELPLPRAVEELPAVYDQELDDDVPF